MPCCLPTATPPSGNTPLKSPLWPASFRNLPTVSCPTSLPVPTLPWHGPCLQLGQRGVPGCVAGRPGAGPHALVPGVQLHARPGLAAVGLPRAGRRPVPGAGARREVGRHGVSGPGAARRVALGRRRALQSPRAAQLAWNSRVLIFTLPVLDLPFNSPPTLRCCYLPRRSMKLANDLNAAGLQQRAQVFAPPLPLQWGTHHRCGRPRLRLSACTMFRLAEMLRLHGSTRRAAESCPPALPTPRPHPAGVALQQGLFD